MIKPRKLAAALAAWLVGGSVQAMPCVMLPSCPSAVSGKAGPFIKQLTKTPPSPPTVGTTTGTGPSQGIGSHSLNRGEFKASRLQMPETQARVRQLLGRLETQWPYGRFPPVPVIMIGNTDYDSEALPDDSIVVSLGLLERAQSDDEVAWVLGHELSHIALHHAARAEALATRKAGLDRLGDMVVLGAIISQERLQRSGQQVNFVNANPVLVQRSEYGALAKSSDIRLVLDLTTSSFSRDQEDQADALGIDFATGAGFAADEGAAHAFDAIAEDDANRKAQLQSTQDEIKSLLNASVTPEAINDIKSGNIAGGLMSFAKSAGQNTFRFGISKGVELLEQDHRTPAARKKSISAYMASAYPTLAPPDTTTVWLKALRTSPEYIEAKIAVAAHDTSTLRLAASDSKGALLAIAPAQRTRFAITPLIEDQTAAAYGGADDKVNADRYYELADRTGDQDIDGYRAHVELLVAMGRYDAALAKVTEGEHRLGDHQPFLPMLIAISIKRNNGEAEIRYVQECMDTQNEELRKNCHYALLNPDDLQKVDKLSPEQRHKLDVALGREGGQMGMASRLSGLFGQLKPAPAAQAPVNSP